MDDTSQRQRLYLDNAATSWPKPPEVIEAISSFYRCVGTAAYRGNASTDADRSIEKVRQNFARFINATSKAEIVFTSNCTDALNIALHGFLSEKDHVVISCLEHNSVLRPLNFLKENKRVAFSAIDTNFQGQIKPEKIESGITENTKLVCVSHVSNVTGVIQPITEIGEICRKHDVAFLVDAAQSLGHIPVDVEAMQCDMLAAPGHKGIMGPLGTGVLYVKSNIAARIKPMRQGGTGSVSDNENQPDDMPTKLESGNLNVGGILGMGAGLEFVERKSLKSIVEHDTELVHHVINQLRKIDSLQLYMSDESPRTSVISFNIGSHDPREVAAILENHFGIEVRAGLHCAPRSHKFLGTFTRGGTIRVSPGVYNTIDEMDVFVEAVNEITKQLES